MAKLSWSRIIRRLRSKEYRDALVAAEIRNGLAAQIRAMRLARGWTQEELGARAGGMRQETVSLLQSPNYGRYTLQTLRRLASAFDVALIVRFVPFSELISQMVWRDYADLAPPDYAADNGLVMPGEAGRTPLTLLVGGSEPTKNDTLGRGGTAQQIIRLGGPETVEWRMDRSDSNTLEAVAVSEK